MLFCINLWIWDSRLSIKMCGLASWDLAHLRNLRTCTRNKPKICKFAICGLFKKVCLPTLPISPYIPIQLGSLWIVPLSNACFCIQRAKKQHSTKSTAQSVYCDGLDRHCRQLPFQQQDIAEFIKSYKPVKRPSYKRRSRPCWGGGE